MENSTLDQRELLHRLMKNRSNNKILMDVTRLTQQQASALIDSLLSAEEDAREDFKEFLNGDE